MAPIGMAQMWIEANPEKWIEAYVESLAIVTAVKWEKFCIEQVWETSTGRLS